MENYTSICSEALILRQEVDYAGNTSREKYPRKLVPVEEREAKELRGLARVDSGKEQADGRKEEKPIPASAALHATNYRLDA
jgi:hypothetical protein